MAASSAMHDGTMKIIAPQQALVTAVPVRTVGEQAYRIREFRVRFHQADMMFQPPADVS